MFYGAQNIENTSQILLVVTILKSWSMSLNKETRVVAYNNKSIWRICSTNFSFVMLNEDLVFSLFFKKRATLVRIDFYKKAI